MSTMADNCNDLKKLIREVPDFPKPGILFYDITTLLKDRLGFARLIDSLTEYYLDKDIDLVLGIEARGFIFGPALAYRLNAGFVPVRKPKTAYEMQRSLVGSEMCIRDSRRHCQSHRRNGEVARRRYLWPGIRGGAGRPQWPR